ncbi:MAG: hypothetical protein ACHRXM_40370 [Isosphaerales bacterium]
MRLVSPAGAKADVQSVLIDLNPLEQQADDACLLGKVLRIRREAEKMAAFLTTDIFRARNGRSSLCPVAV